MSNDQTIRLWDAETGQQRGEPLAGHTTAILSVAFSPDGRMFASAGREIRLWDTETGQSRGAPLDGHVGGAISLAFSPDGQTLASAHHDGVIRLWDIVTEEISVTACRRVNRNLTQEEWRKYLGDEPYQRTCDDLPEGP